MSRRTAAFAAALAVLAALPAAATAGRPGVWTPITSADGGNTDQVGLLRTPDDVLHVAWPRKTPGNTAHDDLLQTLVTPSGRAGAPQTIASDWVGIGSPQLARTGDGRLLLIAGATQSGDPGAIDSIAAWTSPDGGATWAPPVRATSAGGFADDPGLGLGADGLTPFVSWASTFGLYVQRGFDPAAVPGNFQVAAGFGCCGYSPSFARDEGDGKLVVAWHSNATGREGVWVQQVDQASGGPVNTPALMPGSVVRGSGSYSLAHTPITGRPGRAGVWLAYAGGYPTTTNVLLWRYGSPRSHTLATRGSSVGDVTLAVTPEGRLWVAWSGGGRIWARRSNTSATVFGAITSTPVVRGTDVVYKLAANAQDGLLDLLGAFAPTTGGVRTWHTQLRAGLTLTAAPARVAAGARAIQHVRFTVTDAGEPVAGATVRLGAQRAFTGRAGSVTLNVAPGTPRTTLTARAIRTGYVDGTASVQVR